MDVNNYFLEACKGAPVDRIPVWFMRQAGRSLPGYRKLRETYGMLALTQTPELAAQITLEPVDFLGVDAAILFADIMNLPIAMGIDVQMQDGVGPVIDAPILATADISRLTPFFPEKIAPISETIRILRKSLSVPLIGFSGAPFTLASYLIEGRPSRTWQKTKHFMLENPEGWHKLMEKLSDGVVAYLRTQVDAGVQAVQIFDSWVGCLSPAHYEAYVLPYMLKIFSALKETNVPRIHFATNTAGMLTPFSSVDCEVVGIDWRIGLREAKEIVGEKSLQGNLDPAVLFTSWETITKNVDALFSEIDPKKGYIFNLGHGITPDIDPHVVKRLVEYIHAQ